jgi:LPXTG-site transpeptidase (sortase) family protein
MAEHRRRLGRMVFRRLEVATWITAIVVVAVVVALIVVRIPLGVSDVVAGTFVNPSASAAPDASASASPGTANALCFFEPCGRSDLTGPPTYLRIPSINVKTSLEDLVVDGKQVLQPPKTYEKAGWWTQGVVPGDPGPAVIAGHVDSKRGPAVFYDLKSLRAGDLVEVDRGGQVVTFEVYEVEKYPKNNFPTAKVYKPTPGAELRLITCGGLFDEARLSYRDNIVVYAMLR